MAFLNTKSIALSAALAVAAAALFVFLRREREPREAVEIDYVTVGAVLELASFADLKGWRTDDAAQTLAAFGRSCERMMAAADDAPVNPDEQLGVGVPSLAGAVGDWRASCAETARLLSLRFADPYARASAARAFYETYFRPVRIKARQEPGPGAPIGASGRIEATGRFTGYFEPTYAARMTADPAFSAPVYARPDDLVMVDLGRFRPELSGQRIAGRIAAGALDPYPTHADINKGALDGKARVLAYMRPSDLLFLQIQGSGRLALPQGELRVGYDGANGRPYTAVGRTLIEMGALTRETVSMQTIREWLDRAAAADAARVRESNESYVFFRALDALPDPALGPLGAQGAQLTAGRSIAIDKRFTPLGAPVFVSIDGEEGEAPIRRLLIAQDTGGAIKGPVRGDIFIGAGEEAGEAAGVFNEFGEMYVLTPVAVAERLAKATS